MKYLITAIATVVLVGCGNPEADKVLRFAATEGNIEAAKQAVDDGADVNTKNKHERTPLYQAAAVGNKEIIEILIAKGADVNSKNKAFNKTPIDAANGFIKQPDIVELLRKHGGKTGEELKAEGK